MRLVLAVVQSVDAGRVLQALTRAGFRTTRLASTGGFLREGNVTLLTGVDDARVDDAIAQIRANAQRRTKIVAPGDVAAQAIGVVASEAGWLEVAIGGATVFVLDIARFERL